MLSLWIYGQSETFEYKLCLWAYNYRVSGISGMWRGWAQAMHTSHMVLSDIMEVFSLIVFLMHSPNLAEIFPAQKSLWHSLPEGDSVADAKLTCPVLSLTQQWGCWLLHQWLESFWGLPAWTGTSWPSDSQGRSKRERRWMWQCQVTGPHMLTQLGKPKRKP